MAAQGLAETLGIASPHIVGVETFDGILDHVLRGGIGVLPLDNRIFGTVMNAINLLIKHYPSLRIVFRTSQAIDHCLMALSEVDISDIREVYSHPVALGQCRNMIDRHTMTAVDHFDTAGAAEDLRDGKLPKKGKLPNNAGVIASKEAATLYGLTIIREHVGDFPGNRTRFAMVVDKANHHAPIDEPASTILTFTMENTAGSLDRILLLLKKHGINCQNIRNLRNDEK